jgi:hypothetical protein
MNRDQALTRLVKEFKVSHMAHQMAHHVVHKVVEKIKEWLFAGWDFLRDKDWDTLKEMAMNVIRAAIELVLHPQAPLLCQSRLANPSSCPSTAPLQRDIQSCFNA